MSERASEAGQGASSPEGFDARRLVLIIGAPRSGTTWLSRMLAEHPGIAALPSELTVFSAYLAPARAAYARELAMRRVGSAPFGLPALMPQHAFDEALRGAVADVYRRVLATRPEAALVLDKHPGYTHHLDLIESLAPGCRYIHLVRDGRDAVASMLRVPGLMGSSGASVQAAAREWATCVHRAGEHAARVGAERCLTLHYEQLLTDAPDGLARTLGFLGLAADEALVNDIAARHHHSRGLVSQGVASGKAPGAQAWRAALALHQRYWMDRIAGAQLRRWGFASGRWWALGPLDRLRMAGYPFRVKIHDSLKALRGIWSKPITRSVGDP